MSGDRDTLRRRVDQFTALLRPMNRRSHDVAHGPCFMSFDECPPDAPGGQDAAGGAMASEEDLASLLEAFRDLGLFPPPKEGLRLELPEDGWRTGPASSRFIQFSFENHEFHLDLPRQVLASEEAEQILRSRRDFFYLRDRPEHTLHGEDVEGHDPFRKVYAYGREAEAAADMAFVLFQVWKLPVGARLYVSARAFGKDVRWEQALPID